MDQNGKDCCKNENISSKSKAPVGVESEKVELNGERNKDNETKSLLPLPPRRGGLSRKKSGKKTRRKVQWNDKDGKKLAEVLEFQPSDVSDSDDEDLDSCICAIM